MAMDETLGVDPLGPPEVGLGPEPPEPPELPPDDDFFPDDLSNLGLITVKYTGTITAAITKIKADKRRTMVIIIRRLDLGDVVVVVVVVVVGKIGSCARLSLSILGPSNAPESFGVAFK